MFKKYLQFIIIVLPIVILLTASTYLGYDAWQKYKTSANLKEQLNNAQLMQSFEHSVLNEIVCVATMSQHKELMAKVCSKTQKTTNDFMQQIMQQKNDKSLYTLEKVLYNIRTSVKDSGVAAVEKLVNGDLDKQMKKFIERYTLRLKNYSDDITEQESLRLYGKLSDISYATESEKALVSYYLSLKKPIPAKNLIYWGEVSASSEVPEMNKDHVFMFYGKLQKIWQDQKFQTILRHIEDIRMDIMSHSSTGNYTSDVAQWVNFMNQKQKALNGAETLLLNNILKGVDSRIQKAFWMLLFAIAAFLLALIALFTFIAYQKRANNQKDLFSKLAAKVHSISSDNEKAEVTEQIKSPKLAYDYIASNYQELYDKEKTSSEENKAKSAFFANMLYEIRAPLDSMLGYTKLLKETSLNIEQSDFVSIIEHNSENLDKIVSKAANQSKINLKKLEIKNSAFNLVKKIESIAETFAIKADGKDIVLGAFIDPSLPEKLIGDETRLSQVLTNLISNALQSTSAYGTVDLFVKTIHDDHDKVRIKFSVKDSGIGLDQDELNSILEALGASDTQTSISDIEIQNLGITNRIIEGMGGELEIESKKGKGTTFSFTLTLEKNDNASNSTAHPDFTGLKVGLALPSRDVKRQIDKNLEAYVNYLGGEFTIYYNDELFESNREIELPDVMIVYHHYARLEGELEAFTKLGCKIALITTGTLRSRIDTNQYNFSSMVYTPVTMSKTVRILAKSKLDQVRLAKEAEEKCKKFEKIRALVVEDNVISQKLMKNDLQSFGVDVMIAPNGRKAFEMRRENDFDIIFMDIDMPEMDGIEATKKILYYEGINQFKHVPIIALAAKASEDEKEIYIKTGMDDIAGKPFDLDKVADMIQKYCIDLPKEQEASEEDDLIAKVLSGNFLKEE
ncbi:response regulator [Sulfurovum sp.]|uniref:response regulator n=3 Tax=Sulfurovum sp. TaxID=1969726 RepID=UPI0025E9A829|nr:response regulator [Sulfurovum sp.]